MNIHRDDDPPHDDAEKEAMIEALYEALAPLRKYYNPDDDAVGVEDVEDAVVAALEKVVSDAYLKGYDQGRGDEREALEHVVR